MHDAPGRKPCTVPRPIGWISTVDGKGRTHLAPYSQWQSLSFDPPMVLFAANPDAYGRRKHSVLNVEETGWFVWNRATHDLRGAVNISAMEWPEGMDEFAGAGVTQAACI